MRNSRRIVAVAALALGVMSFAAESRGQATELTAGVLGIGFTLNEGDTVTEVATGGVGGGPIVGLGGGLFAIASYVSPGVALEPNLSFSRLSVDGDSLTVLSLGFALPVYFERDWGRRGGYLAPRVAYGSVVTHGESLSQFSLGMALGGKLAINDMAAFRMQVSFDYGLEGDLNATKTIGVFFGLSAFVD